MKRQQLFFVPAEFDAACRTGLVMPVTLQRSSDGSSMHAAINAETLRGGSHLPAPHLERPTLTHAARFFPSLPSRAAAHPARVRSVARDGAPASPAVRQFGFRCDKIRLLPENQLLRERGSRTRSLMHSSCARLSAMLPHTPGSGLSASPLVSLPHAGGGWGAISNAAVGGRCIGPPGASPSSSSEIVAVAVAFHAQATGISPPRCPVGGMNAVPGLGSHQPIHLGPYIHACIPPRQTCAPRRVMRFMPGCARSSGRCRRGGGGGGCSSVSRICLRAARIRCELHRRRRPHMRRCQRGLDKSV
eukprot:361655-Chlamydomonas_euryale.AAC.4